MPYRPNTLVFDPITGHLVPPDEGIPGWDSAQYVPPVDYAPPSAQAYASAAGAPLSVRPADESTQVDYNTPVGQLLAGGRLGGHPVEPDELPPEEPDPTITPGWENNAFTGRPDYQPGEPMDIPNWRPGPYPGLRPELLPNSEYPNWEYQSATPFNENEEQMSEYPSGGLVSYKLRQPLQATEPIGNPPPEEPSPPVDQATPGAEQPLPSVVAPPPPSRGRPGGHPIAPEEPPPPDYPTEPSYAETVAGQVPTLEGPSPAERLAQGVIGAGLTGLGRAISGAEGLLRSPAAEMSPALAILRLAHARTPEEEAAATENLYATFQGAMLGLEGGVGKGGAEEALPGMRRPAMEKTGALRLSEMSPEELEVAYRTAREAERATDVRVLGEDGAAEWDRLQRVANGKDTVKADAASNRIAEIEATLTNEQQRLLYGIGETGPTADDYLTFRHALQRLNFDSEEQLGNSLKVSITAVRPGKIPDTETAQLALAQLRYALEHGKQLGFDMQKVSEAALRGAARRFNDVEDAYYMLRDLLQPTGITPAELRVAAEAGIALPPGPASVVEEIGRPGGIIIPREYGFNGGIVPRTGNPVNNVAFGNIGKLEVEVIRNPDHLLIRTKLPAAEARSPVSDEEIQTVNAFAADIGERNHLPIRIVREDLGESVREGSAISPGPEGAAQVREAPGGATGRAGLPPGPPPPGPPPPGPPPHGPPPGAEPPTGGALEKLHAMWDAAERRPTMIERLQAARHGLPDAYRSLQEKFTDRFAGLNALSPLVEQEIARVGGIGEVQVQRAMDIAKTVKTALGEPWPEAGRHLDDWLHLRQAIDIEASKGPQRLIPGGIKGAAQAQATLDELHAYLGDARWQQLERAGAAAVQESQRTLEYLVENGLVSRELADVLLEKYPHYNRQNILHEVQQIGDNQVSHAKISVTSANLRRLTEEGTEAARTSPYASIIGSAADAESLVFRNRAARAAAEEAIAQGIGEPISGARQVAVVEGKPIYRRPPGDIPGTISYMEDGVRKLVAVPSWAAKEAVALKAGPETDIVSSISAVNSIPRAMFVTYNPTWPAANLVSDYMDALMVKGVTPAEMFRSLAGAIRDLSENDPVLAQMRRSGGGQAGWFAPDAAHVAKLVRESGNLVITSESQWRRIARDPLSLLTTPFRGVRTVGQVLEQTTRRAVFQTELGRQGVKILSEGQIYARPGVDVETALGKGALAARRTTIDFARGGEWTKAVNAVSIFLNAGVQSLLLPFRAVRDSPRTRWAFGTAIGVNAAVYAYNRQYPEYQDVPADVKRGSLVLMLPSQKYDTQGKPIPRYLTVIPKMRTWSLFFGTQTYILESLDGMAHEDLTRFLGLLASQATPIQGMGALASLATVPGQIGIEHAANYDFYRQRAIVPPELAGQPAREQYDAYTSDTLKRVAQSLGISPMMLQHGFYSFTGGSGQAVTSLTDAALQKLSPAPVDFRIAQLAHELDQITPPAVPPNEVALRRMEYLSSLGPKDREAVMELARQPQSQVPLLGPIAGRFYGERGGEEYRLGQRAAEATTGKSAVQTAAVSKLLSKLSDRIDTLQSSQDAVLAANPHEGKKWREAHHDNALLYQGGLLALGVEFPSAAQSGDKTVWGNYQHAVYTLAGAEGDRRTKGQILAAGYRAIPLEELDPLTSDFRTFFQKRGEFRAALSTEDKALLDRALLASMTPTERQYTKDQETLRPYWERQDMVEARLPGYAAARKEVERAGGLSRFEAQLDSTPQGPAYNRLYAAFDVYKEGEHQVAEERRKLRESNKDIETAGEKWYDWQQLKPVALAPRFRQQR